VNKDEVSWVKLVSMRSRKVINADFQIQDSGELDGRIILTSDGIAAGSIRKSIGEAGKEKYVKDFLSNRDWEVSKSNFENLERSDKSLKESYELVIKDHTQLTNSLIYLDPYLINKIEENPFKSDKRKYPIDFGSSFDKIYMFKIQVPSEYIVEELPKSKIILLPENAGKFVYNITAVGNTINLMSQFIMNKSIFKVEEYPFLKELYSQVIAKQAEQIVLKKK
jgi:hypothetical protein